jgi:hypothetical protein
MSTSTSHPASGGGTGTVPVHWHGWIHSGRKLLQLETLHETEQGATDELLHHGGLAYAPAPCAEISCLRGKRPRYLDSRELPSNPERFKMMGGQAVAGRIARGEDLARRIDADARENPDAPVKGAPLHLWLARVGETGKAASYVGKSLKQLGWITGRRRLEGASEPAQLWFPPGPNQPQSNEARPHPGQ